MADDKYKRPTIADTLNYVAAKICDDYCKWPEKCAGKGEEGEGELYEKHCNFCPLNLLGL